jgi:hypothetical protein
MLPPPNPIQPSALAAPIIAPTTAETWSAPFRVAPQLAAGGVNPFANVPTRIGMMLTAPNGQRVPPGAGLDLYLIDSQGNLNKLDMTHIAEGEGEPFYLVVGDYMAYKPASSEPYGLDAIGYSSQANEAS